MEATATRMQVYTPRTAAAVQHGAQQKKTEGQSTGVVLDLATGAASWWEQDPCFIFYFILSIGLLLC